MITVDFKTIKLPEASIILDIGCGSGRHTAAACNFNEVTVIGADSNQKDLEQARQRLRFHDRIGAHGNNSKWALNTADITALPFRDHSFDLVVCSEVLEHIPRHRKALEESTRVLKPGACLVVSVPRRWPETLCWAFSRQYRNTPGGHIRIYKAAQLKKRIQAMGFSHLRTHWAHSLHTPYWWLKCLLGVNRDQCYPVKQYQRFLTWDIMKKPPSVRMFERLLNPMMGKSVVFYFFKA
ncbi:MAG: class I SAM-dependent methyltransferase [Desulfobacteraceae bacterium]|nr:class I SAM-dependent methyltransferase [Desulfobacteraceae bacterium]